MPVWLDSPIRRGCQASTEGVETGVLPGSERVLSANFLLCGSGESELAYPSKSKPIASTVVPTTKSALINSRVFIVSSFLRVLVAQCCSTQFAGALQLLVVSIIREADDLPTVKSILTEVPLIGTRGTFIGHRTSFSFPTPLTPISSTDQSFFIRQFEEPIVIVLSSAMDFILELLRVVHFGAVPLLVSGLVSDDSVRSKDGFDEIDIFTQDCLCFGIH